MAVEPLLVTVGKDGKITTEPTLEDRVKTLEYLADAHVKFHEEMLERIADVESLASGVYTEVSWLKKRQLRFFAESIELDTKTTFILAVMAGVCSILVLFVIFFSIFNQ